jgi:uncharacterized protein involved in exopolysaccharide biosynthesis
MGQMTLQRPSAPSVQAELYGRAAPLAVDATEAAFLARIWRAVMRSAVWIAAAAMVGAALGYGVASLSPRSYVAASQVMLNTRAPTPNAMTPPISGLALSVTALASEIDLIRSTAIIERVVERLGLLTDPDFVASLAEPSDADGPVGNGDGAPVTAQGPTLVHAVESILKNLEVDQNGPVSAVYTITYTAASPRIAMLITNTVAEEYIEFLIDRKLSGVERTQSWLETRASAISVRIGEISRELERLRLQAPASPAEVETLRVERTTLMRRMNDLTAQPEAGVAAAIAAIDARLGAYAAHVSEIARLQREFEAAQMIYDDFVGGAQRLSEAQLYLEPEATIISRAQPPERPSWPSFKMLVALGFVGGGAVAFGAVVWREIANPRLRTEQDVVDAAGAPVVGVFPLAAPGAATAGAAARARARLERFLGAPAGRGAPVIALASVGGAAAGSGDAVAMAYSRAGRRALLVTIRAGVGAAGADAGNATAATPRPLDDAPGRPEPAEPARFDMPADEALLASQQFDAWLASARRRYDAILIEVPSSEGTFDPTPLWGAADAIISVVHWNRTQRVALERFTAELAAVGAVQSGVFVLSVDPRRVRSYANDALAAAASA